MSLARLWRVNIKNPKKPSKKKKLLEKKMSLARLRRVNIKKWLYFYILVHFYTLAIKIKI